MLTLHLLRHAKSDWDEPGLDDRERGLNRRGRRDAPRMGAALAAELVPVDIHVSPARRAQLTLRGLVEGWPELARVEHWTEEGLYTFDAEELLEWIAGCGETRDTLFLIGHNPAFTDLVNFLAGAPVIDKLPTAAYARLVLEADSWAALGPGCASLQRLLRPRELPQR